MQRVVSSASAWPMVCDPSFGPVSYTHLITLKKGLGSLAKNAGVALVIASLAGLALALKSLGSLGPSAVAPLLTFGAVVGGLVAVSYTHLDVYKRQTL